MTKKHEIFVKKVFWPFLRVRKPPPGPEKNGVTK